MTATPDRARPQDRRSSTGRLRRRARPRLPLAVGLVRPSPTSATGCCCRPGRCSSRPSRASRSRSRWRRFLQLLPWVVFGIPGGALIDRVDRRRLSVVVNLARALVLLVLTATIATGTVNLPIVLGQPVRPRDGRDVRRQRGQRPHRDAACPRSTSGVANSRLSGTRIVANELAGPPIGALLFGVGMAAAVRRSMPSAPLAAAVLIAPDRRHSRDRDPATVERRHIRHEIADGDPLAVESPAGPRPGADDLPVQRHVLGAVLAVRPVRDGAPRPRRGRLRPAHHGRGDRRAGRLDRRTRRSSGGSRWRR